MELKVKIGDELFCLEKRKPPQNEGVSVGAAGFEPTTSPTRTVRASQTAPRPERLQIIGQALNFASEAQAQNAFIPLPKAQWG